MSDAPHPQFDAIPAYDLPAPAPAPTAAPLPTSFAAPPQPATFVPAPEAALASIPAPATAPPAAPAPAPAPAPETTVTALAPVAVTVDEPATEPAAAAEKTTRSRSGKRNPERAAIRRIATKLEQIRTAAPEHLELLSTALGVTNSPIELTVAVMAGNRSALSALNDTIALSVPMDPYDGIIAATALGRPRIRGVWSVLNEFGAVQGALPAADIAAGGAIAKAAGNLSQDNLDEITAVLALAKK